MSGESYLILIFSRTVSENHLILIFSRTVSGESLDFNFFQNGVWRIILDFNYFQNGVWRIILTDSEEDEQSAERNGTFAMRPGKLVTSIFNYGPTPAPF